MKPAREIRDMAVTVLSSNPKVQWPRLAHDLSLKLHRPAQSLLGVVDVWQAWSEAKELHFGGPDYLLVGEAAHQFFARKLPSTYRMKSLDYGAAVPILYIVDEASGFSKFFTALYIPEPYSLDGRNIYNGLTFLLESQPMRDKLFVHQIRRTFAPHETSIFAVDPRTLPAPPAANRLPALRTATRGRPPGLVPLPGAQEDDLPF